MAIPDYQSMMLPVLELAGDGKVHKASEAIEAIAARFNLTAADREELLPSGTGKTLYNRVHWVLTYLRRALVLRSEGRALFAITDRGRALLAEHLDRIDKTVLSRYPEYIAFVSGEQAVGKTSPQVIPIHPVDDLTLDETLDRTHAALKGQFEQALLDRIKKSTPEFFERLVIDVLVKMGYGGSEADAAKHLGGSGDGGVDGVIKEDKLGLESLYIQAKKWEGAVGRPAVQAFVGSLEGQHARKGVFITTASFSEEAKRYVASIEKRIVLIEGSLLVRLLLEYGVGTRVDRTYPVYSMDESYFGAEEPSVL